VPSKDGSTLVPATRSASARAKAASTIVATRATSAFRPRLERESLAGLPNHPAAA
jgi:hypothetical protein